MSYNAGNLRGKDGDFRSFDTPEAGFNALVSDITAKVSGNSPAMKAKLGDGYQPTISNLISVYAPPEENNTKNYIDFVSKKSGLHPDTPLTAADINRIIPPMIEMEHGRKGAEQYKQYASNTQQTNDASKIDDWVDDPAPQKSTAQINDWVDDATPNTSASGDKVAPYGISGLITGKTDAPKVDLFDTVSDNALQGATFGIGNRAQAGLAALALSGINGQPVADNYKRAREVGSERMAAEMDQHPATAITSNIAGGLATGGLAGSTKVGAAVGNSIRSGGTVARIVKGGVAGAASGAAYGAGSADYGKSGEGAVKGAVIGGVAGAALPAVAATAVGAKNALFPKIEQKTAVLAQRAKDLGIDLRLDQLSPTRARQTVQKVSQEIPFSGVDAAEQTQRAQWNKAVAKEIGQDAEDLGPETINNFITSASQKFQSALAGKPIAIQPDDIAAIDGIVAKAPLSITDDLVKIVKANVKSLKADIKNGNITGDTLASARSELIGRIPGAAAGAKQKLGELVDVIDNIAERNLTDEAAATLTQARYEWRNFKTIEPLLEKSVDGNINPTDLLQRVASSKYIKASRAETGQDNLVDLARIGKRFLPKLGGSDTAQKAALMVAAKRGATVAGGTIGLGGLTAVNPLAALSGAALSGAVMAGNRGMQKVNQSKTLVDLAVKNSGKAAKQVSVQPSRKLTLPIGIAGLSATQNRK